MYSDRSRKPKQTQRDVSPPFVDDLEHSNGSARSLQLALEPRFMFDGAAVATVATVLADAAVPHPPIQDPGEKSVEPKVMTAAPSLERQAPAQSNEEGTHLAAALQEMQGTLGDERREIVFVDSSVPELSTILKGIDPGAELILLDASRDGLDQIAAALQGRTNIDALHVISHGQPGELRLGSSAYDTAALSRQAGVLAAIGTALDGDADILLYGCDIGQGNAGEQFVAALSDLTGADVAASVDGTGAARLGGNWVLEHSTGAVESGIAVTLAGRESFQSLLAPPVLDLNSAAGSTTANNTGRDWTAVFTENQAPVSIADGQGSGDADDASLTDIDSATLASGQIVLINRQTDDYLSINGVVLSNGLTGSFNGISYSVSETATAITVNLAGSASTSAYLGLIQATTFANRSESPNVTVRDISVKVNDGTADSNIARALITVVGVTDPPSNTVPGAQSVAEDTGRIFSAANGNAITVASPENGLLTVTLSVTNGTLTLGSTAGVTLRAGDGIADNTMTFEGTQAQVNAAMNGLRFDPNADYNGAARITIRSEERVLSWVNGGFESPDVTRAQGYRLFTETDVPGWETDATDNQIEIWQSGFSGVPAYEGEQFAEINANQVAALFQTFSAPAGSTIGVSFAHRGRSGVDVMRVVATDLGADGRVGGGDDTVLLSEQFSDGQAWRAYSRQLTTSSSGNLIRFEFRAVSSAGGSVSVGNFVDGIEITPRIDDVDTVDIAVTPVRDTVADTVTTNEDTAATFNVLTGAGGARADNFESSSAVVTGVSQPPNGSVTFTPNGQMVFTPAANFSGTTSFTYTVSSGGVTETETVTLVVAPVNDPPVLDLDASGTGTGFATSYVENAAGVAIVDLDSSVTDIDSLEMASASFVITNGQAGDVLAVAGALPVGITASYDAATFTLTLAGSASRAAYETALGQVRFSSTSENPATVSRSINVRVNDGALNSNTAVATVAVAAVNDPPSNSLPAAYSVAEDSALSLTGLSIDDPDAGTGTLSVTLSVPAGSGTLSANAGTGVAVTGSGTGSLTLSGTRDAINVYLASTAAPAYRQAVGDAQGTVLLTMVTNDGGNSGGPAREAISAVTITTVPVADIANDSVSTPEDTPVVIDVLANDSFENPGRSITAVDGAAITAGGPSVAVSNGSVALNSAGQLVFTPSANYNGLASFTYTVTSGGIAETATVEVLVAGVNDGPVVNPPDLPDLRATDAETVSFGVASGFTDPDGDRLSYSASGLPPGLSIDPISGVISGTLASGASGATGQQVYPITVTASDGKGGTVSQQIDFTVVNVAPRAANDTATTLEEVPVTLDVLANDTDLDGDALVISSVNGTALTVGGAPVETQNGSVSLVLVDGRQQLVFTPNTDFSGQESFSYTVADGNGGTASATATVTVTPVNDPPVAPDRDFTVLEDTPVTLNPLAGATDPDGDTLTITQINGTPITPGTTVAVANGAVTLNADGTLTFVPAQDYDGQVSFTYTVADGNGATDQGEIRGIISDVDDAPIANNDTAITDENTALSFSPERNVLSNDTDQDIGDTQRVSQVNGSAGNVGVDVIGDNGGVFRILADGTYAFNPNGDFEALAGGQTRTTSVTYQVVDSFGQTSSATVTVTVSGVNDAPVVNPPDLPDLRATDAETVSFGVASGFTDPDGDTLSYSASGLPPGLSIDSISGVISGTLALGASGATGQQVYPITVTASDGKGGTVSQQIDFTVVNVAPRAANDTATTLEEVPVTLDVLANDTDLDGDALVISSVNGTALTVGGAPVETQNGSVSLVLVDGRQQLVFTPSTDFSGQESFSYTVADGNGGTASATATVTVTPVNDPPVALADTATTSEDTPVFGNVLANDTDVDGNPLSVQSFTVPGVSGTIAAGTPAVIPNVGTLTINANGSFTFTPETDYSGTVPEATYTISDGQGATASAALNITITPANDPPVAVADTATTPEDTPVIGNVLVNDTDVDGNPLSVQSFTVPGVSGTISAGTAAVIPNVGTLTINADGSYTFTPESDYSGAVPEAIYTISDGQGATASAALNITITPVNDPPVAVADTTTTPEDTPVTGNVLANDTDVDRNPLSVESFSVPGVSGTISAGTAAVIPNVGTITINANGSYTFAPGTNYSGPVPRVTYTISDGQGGTASAALDITITPVNDAPVGVADTATTLEDTPVTGNVLTNDTDIDSANFTVTRFGIGGTTYSAGQTATLDGVGSLVINANGAYTFTPALEYTGPVPVATYTVSDGALTSTATLTVTITPVNDAPAGADRTVAVTEDAVYTFAAADFGFTDAADGNTLSAVVITTLPANGTLRLNGVAVTAGQVITAAQLGQLTWQQNTADANGNGLSSFAFQVRDNGGTLNGGVDTDPTPNIFTFNVTPVADITNDAVTTPEDTPIVFNVITGTNGATADSFENAGRTVTSVTQPATGGTVSFLADGTLTFTPTPNFNGVATFTYTVTSGGVTETATATVNVTAVNDAPVGVNDTATTLEDTPVSGNVLTNDTDIDIDSGNLTVTQFVVGGTTYTAGSSAVLAGIGTLVINADGSYTFTPALNYNGPVPVATYTVSDGALTSTATLAVTITPVNDAPVGVNDTATTLEDTPVSGNVLTNDTDVDNANLTVTQFVIGGATYTAGQTATLAGVGTLVINANGSYTFTPAANYSGSVPVATYTVSDGALASTATLAVAITPINDAPVAVNDTVTTPEDTVLSIPVGTLTGNDTDVDGNPLTITSVQTPVGGTVALVGGNVVFTPAPDFNGPASFTYTISDGQGGTSTATVTVNVTPVNDGPVGVNDTATTLENTPATGNVLTNDTDIDSANLAVTQFVVGGTTYTAGSSAVLAGIGTLVINADGSYTFTPALNYNGPVPAATYTVSDGALTSTATLAVTITPVNDAPVGVNDTATTLEDTPVSGNVLTNDTDVDNATLTVTQFVIGGTTYTAGQTATLAGVGTLVINANGSYTFTPAANYSGSVPVATYTVSDGALASTATLAVAIAPINDAPGAVDDRFTSVRGETVTFDVRGNDADVEAEELSVTEIDGKPISLASPVAVEGGTVSLNADGSLTFTPGPGFSGKVSFRYTVTDSQGASASALVDGEVGAAPAQPAGPASSMPTTDIQALLNLGRAAMPPDRLAWIQAQAPRPVSDMYVPPHIIEAVNGIRTLNGIGTLHTAEPVRAAVYGIRSLDGLAPIDVRTPVLDTVEEIERRFGIMDSAEAMFVGKADARVENAMHPSRDLVLEDSALGAPAAPETLTSEVNATLPPVLTFSQLIALQAQSAYRDVTLF